MNPSIVDGPSRVLAGVLALDATAWTWRIRTAGARTMCRGATSPRSASVCVAAAVDSMRAMKRVSEGAPLRDAHRRVAAEEAARREAKPEGRGD